MDQTAKHDAGKPRPTLVPVVYGHWIEDEDGDGRHCSQCGADYCYIVEDAERYRYCPHCGARMDKEAQQ